MSTFDESNPGNTGNRERPEPGDPEAQYYQNRENSDARQNQQRNTGYGFGYPPGMDPDGFAHRPGWQGQPGWQPWAGGGYHYRRHRPFNFWMVLLAIVLIALLFKPLLHVAFGLVGLGFALLLIALPFIILAAILRAFFWRRHWGYRGWRRGGPWGGPWGW